MDGVPRASPASGRGRATRYHGDPITKEARHGRTRAGQWPVQLRFKTDLTGEQYVTQSAWLEASLPGCPLHPRGGCGFARHGTYPRASPAGALIARWYCPLGHRTFSLLPDCLAARLPGTLAELERIVERVERASSMEAAADGMRTDIELPGALRWIRRRVKATHRSLHLLKGLLPDPLAAWSPTVSAFRQGLAVDELLPRLREIADTHLPLLPPPLGFRPPPLAGGDPHSALQHDMGPDPPRGCA